MLKSWKAARTGAAWLAVGAVWLIAGSRAESGGRPGAGNLHFTVYGDTRDGHAMHRKIVADMTAQKPQFVLVTGDCVASGADSDLWHIWDGITENLRHQSYFYMARGNHDVGGAGYTQRVTAPFTSGNRLYYSFDRERCHFAALDCYTAYNTGSAQYQWLEKDLAAHQNSRFRFVYFHEPPYSIGSHGSNFVLREALCPLFRKYHVSAVFNGHDHNYYHTTRDGIAYLVTGGGGAPLYPCNPKTKGAIEGDRWEKVNNYVVCDIVGPTMRVTAYRSDNTPIDSFTVQGKP